MRSNRYVVALAGVIFHLMIGSVYAWSVYAKPIASQTSWSESAISFALVWLFSSWECLQLSWVA